ncbi:MAG: glycerol-3-phosphate 1-O-acyltransferase PlsY [Bacteroidetes bacterium]|nr:glycerol-3-phosphate 1-O-acyltransferase PlsY [Rhodothermia bacterium]MCS7155798.1 glycerol-3-phosphate 1-O-acyltransferase PlsY [Bacteroidota bacterium]MCX7906101.1 glycerol-3-phosphate 1-O-acyltransferase PlsY [Bacteroidota bacterium]MDW8138229.1 glycerol-3-phosphate 1-O-acyltransferase PlsY [Bacteroidota bacterium]MDW8285913.1 glycerol-3-phosphate 1-O-acyltransferase PlsY [Bacteroidota bacterium]
MVSLALILILSYLVGAIPTGVLISRRRGIDIREHGSGNPGMTNTWRVLGWRAGVLVGLLDMGKGLVATGLIATLRIDSLPAGLANWQVERILAGLAAVLGHMYPIWSRFRGGKGVSTSAGALLAITTWTTLICAGIFVLVALLSRYASLGSIAAALAFPIVLAIRKYIFHVPLDNALLPFGVLLAGVILYAHRANIRRLLNGTENRIRLPSWRLR